MTQEALGLIETRGLAAAIEAADAATKAANIRLIGYEKTKGGGWIVVKFRGDVGAVQAAVAAGVAAAQRINQVIACHVIARPHNDTEILASTADRGPAAERYQPPAPVIAPIPAAEPVVAEGPVAAETAAETAVVIEAPPTAAPAAPELPEAEEGVPPAVEEKPVPPQAEREEEAVAPAPAEEGIAPTGEMAPPPAAPAGLAEVAGGEVCNLCGDPACPRRKGQPRKLCIHYQAE